MSDWVVGASWGSVIGGVIGTAFGALIGSQVQTEGWDEVTLDRLRVSFAPKRDEVALGFTFAF